MIKRNRAFVVLIALVTLAFGWVLLPRFGAVFWAVAFVIVLDPMASCMSQHLGQRPNLAALIMITGFLLLTILPTFLILTAVVREANSLITAVQSTDAAEVASQIAFTAAFVLARYLGEGKRDCSSFATMRSRVQVLRPYERMAR